MGKRTKYLLAALLVVFLVSNIMSTTKARTSTKVCALAEIKTPPVASALVIDVPGVEVREVYRVDEVELRDDHWVTGVVVDGQARAYLETGMDQPETHIAYDNIKGVSLAVAFCNYTGDGRVFCGDSNSLRSIRVGGWAEENMQLIVGDQRFAVDSQEIPLSELPFQSMKWSEWKGLYPNTDIYLGSILPKQH